MRYNNIIYLFTAIGMLPSGSGYFTFKQNMKLVTTDICVFYGFQGKKLLFPYNFGFITEMKSVYCAIPFKDSTPLKNKFNVTYKFLKYLCRTA